MVSLRTWCCVRSDAYRAHFHLVVTNFFIDTAENVRLRSVLDLGRCSILFDSQPLYSSHPTSLSFSHSPSCVIQVIELAETVRHVLAAGGKWINHGPLQWHSSTALMLSLDEVLLLTSVLAVGCRHRSPYPTAQRMGWMSGVLTRRSALHALAACPVAPVVRRDRRARLCGRGAPAHRGRVRRGRHLRRAARRRAWRRRFGRRMG